MDAINTTDGNAERLATLKSLYPDLFNNEGKLNITELQKLADPNSVNETERFEFKWFGKSQAKPSATPLRPPMPHWYLMQHVA